MSLPPAFGGGLFIVDKSAYARSDRPPLEPEWRRAVDAKQILTCQITRLEILYSARTREEFEAYEAELALLRDLAITQTVCASAIAALRDLAARSDGYHRVNIADALIAACAAENGVGVLHYDKHYERLAQVLSFESRWAADAGTLDETVG
jgi:predicted nucleic acid-binding protein